MLPWPVGVYPAGIMLTLPISFLTGFEGCSMVPTIYPLETLHNALSLRQVSEFLSRVCQRHTEAQAQASAGIENPFILNHYLFPHSQAPQSLSDKLKR